MDDNPSWTQWIGLSMSSTVHWQPKEWYVCSITPKMYSLHITWMYNFVLSDFISITLVYGYSYTLSEKRKHLTLILICLLFTSSREYLAYIWLYIVKRLQNYEFVPIRRRTAKFRTFSAFVIFEYGGIFIVPHPLWHRAWDPKKQLQFVALDIYDKHGTLGSILSRSHINGSDYEKLSGNEKQCNTLNHLNNIIIS